MPPSPKNEGKDENEDEKQVNENKRKRDEVDVENKTMEEVVSECEQDKPETLTSLNDKYAGTKTINLSKLPYSVEPADLENIFKHCGEIVRIILGISPDGRFRGYGHVEFTTTEAAQKALQLDKTELLRCQIKVKLERRDRIICDASTAPKMPEVNEVEVTLKKPKRKRKKLNKTSQPKKLNKTSQPSQMLEMNGVEPRKKKGKSQSRSRSRSRTKEEKAKESQPKS